MADRNRARGLLLAAITSVVWGTVPLAGLVALPGINASVLSAMRLFSAAAFLALVLSGGGRRLRAVFSPPPRLVYAAGLFLGSNFVFYMWGVERIGAGTAQVLIQLAPLFLIVLGAFFLGERPTARQLAGAMLAFLGCGLVSFERGGGLKSGHFLGIALIVAGSLTWAVYAVLHKKLGRDHGSGVTMMWIFLIAGLCTAPGAIAEPARRPDAVEVGAIAFLCLNTVVAYWCFAECLRHIPAHEAAVITTLGPVVTFAGLALFHELGWERIPPEPITIPKLAGAAVVIAGVLAAVTARKR